ncbi:MAG: sigma-70 family RNA polymerase sigma factor [Syntrophobacterales bacterium]|nr:sigma-70 family RNA polymerase sigma factor [Syntrophobacterales bacterium]
MEDLSSISDEMAIKRVLEGDIQAFEVLVMRHQGTVARILSRHVPSQDVEDIAQEVFLSALLNLNKLKDPRAFGSWITKIATRSCVNYWRSKLRRKEELFSELKDEQFDLLERSLFGKGDLADDITKEEIERLEEILWWALSHLSPMDRIVIELIYFENLGHMEVAEMTGCTKGGVKIRAFRARRKLRKIVEQELKRRSHEQKDRGKTF